MKLLSKSLFILSMILPTSVYAADLLIVSGNSVDEKTTVGLAEKAHQDALKSVPDQNLYVQFSAWKDELHECSEADKSQNKCQANWLVTSASFVKKSDVGQELYANVKGYSCRYENDVGRLKPEAAIACWKSALDNAAEKANFYCNSVSAAIPLKVTLDYGDMSSNEDDDNMRALSAFKCPAK